MVIYIGMLICLKLPAPPNPNSNSMGVTPFPFPVTQQATPRHSPKSLHLSFAGLISPLQSLLERQVFSRYSRNVCILNYKSTKFAFILFSADGKKWLPPPLVPFPCWLGRKHIFQHPVYTCVEEVQVSRTLC